MAKKDKEKRKERDASDGHSYTRRGLFQVTAGRIAAGLAAKSLAEVAAEKAYDVALNARQPIPPDLQRETPVMEGDNRVLIGLGNSNMAGQGAGNVPLVHRVAEQARHKGISASAVSAAKNGTTTEDLERQAREAKTKLPPGTRPEDLEVHGWAWENNVRDDEEVAPTLQSLSRNPLQPRLWAQYPGMRQRVRARLKDDIKRDVGAALDETGAHSLTLYGPSPVHQSKQINQVDPATGQTTRTPVRGNSAQEKLTQLALADLERQGTQALIDAARELRDERRIQVNVVDSAAALGEEYFSGDDQHFNARGAESVARSRVRRYRKKDFQVE